MQSQRANTCNYRRTQHQLVSNHAIHLLHTDRKHGNKYKKIVSGSCGAHSIDMWVKDVCKLPYFVPLIASVKRLVNVVYNHDMVHSAYVDEGGQLISRFVDTCFSIVSLMCEKIKANHRGLIRTTATAKWDKWKQFGHSRKAGNNDGDKTYA